MTSSQPSHIEGGSSGLKLTRKEPRFTRGERLVIIVGFGLFLITVLLDVVWFPGRAIQTNATILSSEAEAWVALAIFVEGWFSYQNWLRDRNLLVGTVGPPITPPPGSAVSSGLTLGTAGGAPSHESRPDQRKQNMGEKRS